MSIQTLTARFTELITAGVSSFQEAGEILVRILDEFPSDGRDAVLTQCPGISRDVLELFEAIGRRTLYPLLAIDESTGAEYLSGLPYDDQERYCREGIPVVEVGDGDDWPVEITRVHELTHRECLQVFKGKRIRTAREQRAWIEEEERLRKVRQHQRKALAPPRHEKVISGGDRTGWEPDPKMSPISFDRLATAGPSELLKAALDTAHAAMLDARRHLAKLSPRSSRDELISQALSAIGKLRFSLANGEL